jgi:phosphoglycolate phosphatase
MAARTLLFDLDGTLSDNYAGIAASICHALARLDVALPDATVLRACVGPPLRESFPRLLGTDDPALVERAIALYRERFSASGWYENIAYDGIDEALKALSATGARMFICTAKPETFARRIAAHFGFDAWIERVYGTDLAGHYDDKTRLMAHLLATERVDPARAAMIGDRGNDIRAAHANGVRAIGVLWGYGSREELAEADALVATAQEMVSALA